MGKLKPSEMQNTINFLTRDFIYLISEVGRVEQTDEYWEEVAQKANEINNKNGKKLFYEILILALMEYLDILYQVKKKPDLDYVDVTWRIPIKRKEGKKNEQQVKKKKTQ